MQPLFGGSSGLPDSTCQFYGFRNQGVRAGWDMTSPFPLLPVTYRGGIHPQVNREQTKGIVYNPRLPRGTSQHAALSRFSDNFETYSEVAWARKWKSKSGLCGRRECGARPGCTQGVITVKRPYCVVAGNHAWSIGMHM